MISRAYERETSFRLSMQKVIASTYMVVWIEVYRTRSMLTKVHGQQKIIYISTSDSTSARKDSGGPNKIE